jgi:hypothetical protein
MIRIMHGVVNGKTIELAEDPGVPSGQEVEVRVTTLPDNPSAWGEGLRGCAGALSAEWTEEDDRILQEIYQERQQDHRQRSRTLCHTLGILNFQGDRVG